MFENLNFGSSVVKREGKPLGDVVAHLKKNGWKKTGELSSRVVYLANSGVNITLIGGPMGTTIIPSGPIRGMVFGDVDLFSDVSVLGAGKSATPKEKTKPDSSDRDGRKTLN